MIENCRCGVDGASQGTVANKETAAWEKRAFEYLLSRYGLTLEDIGQSTSEFVERWKDQGETPEEAVDAFAEKYDLQAVPRW